MTAPLPIIRERKGEGKYRRQETPSYTFPREGIAQALLTTKTLTTTTTFTTFPTTYNNPYHLFQLIR